MRKTILPPLITFLVLSTNINAQKICFEKNGEIYIANADRSNIKLITKGIEPKLSSNGKIIVFTATENNGNRYVTYVNVASRIIKRFKKIPKTESYSPEFTPDGKYITFNYWDTQYWSTGQVDLRDTKFFKISSYEKTTAKPLPQQEEGDRIFPKVERVAEFPGGIAAWKKYLEKNLNLESIVGSGVPAGIHTVRVQFMVDKEGNISGVRALNDPGFGMAEEAMSVIKKSPKWKAATQNGKPVSFQMVQGITFQIDPAQK